MPSNSNKKGILILENGLELEGELFGAPVSAKSFQEKTNRDRGYGEVVFNTSLTGYQEILTDPSYYGQIVCMTYPHIGNTGVNLDDPESAHPWCAGFIVHNLTDHPSNWRSVGSLEDYMVKHGIPGLKGVDTRALTRHLRSTGVIRGVILPLEEKTFAKDLLSQLPSFEGRDLIAEVSTAQPYFWKEPAAQANSSNFPPGLPQTRGSSKLRVVAMDFGVKRNLLRGLAQMGCEVEVVPCKTTAQEILKRKPQGVFLSNGPGDPEAAPYAAETVRGLLGNVPIFGVCMGHQILALALGARTYKLKFGHRGGNQPVLDRTTGRVEISSHNHGYSVDETTLPAIAQVTHINLNDKTVEGLVVPNAKAFSVQYHPEACPGPHDSLILFERFIDLMSN